MYLKLKWKQINSKVNGVYILKSGSDFRQFSKITLDFKEKEIEIECVEVTKEIEPDEEMAKKLEEYKGIRILIDIINAMSAYLPKVIHLDIKR